MPAINISQSMLVNQGLSARLALGGASEALTDPAGPPVADVVGSFKGIIADPGVSVADRNLSGIIAAITSPLDLATYFINAKYAELGSADGLLGRTVSAVAATANHTGFVRTFQNGSIYWHPQVGAHELHGPIRVRWSELGGEQGFLGFPSSDVTPGADVRAEGFFAHFQGGSIYWAPLLQPAAVLASIARPNALASASTATAGIALNSPAINHATAAALNGNHQSVSTNGLRLNGQAHAANGNIGNNGNGVALAGSSVSAAIQASLGDLRQVLETSAGAFEIHGAIREKYLALGAEASILGYPRTDESGTPDAVGRYNHFQGGSIYCTPGTGAHEVHGLIRDRWASLGWERNAQLGYPVTDELIPDPRVGHRRPEVIKKPILAVPAGVIKLPAEAASAGLPPSVVNTPLSVAAPALGRTSVAAVAATPTLAAATLAVHSAAGALGRLTDTSVPAAPIASGPALRQEVIAATLDPVLLSSIGLPGTPASTPAEKRSVNRFADFESGVLFWFRGATSATLLSPLAATSDGTSLSFSGADIAAITVSKIGKSSVESPNAQLTSMNFAGTTGYSFDGVQVHNRRHRIQLILQGMENHAGSGLFGSLISQAAPVTATVELQVEVWFDASQRRIVLAPTDWTLTQASSSSYAAAVEASLRVRLDPLLWSSFELLTLPDTDGGAPIAVLSVKTLANGAVGVFVEPQNSRLLGSFSELANAVPPSVFLFPQPN